MKKLKNLKNFKKGQSGNPGGRPKTPDDIREFKKLNKDAFDRTLNRLIHMPRDEFKDILREPKIEMLEYFVAKIVDAGCTYGDQRRLEFVLDRLIGKAPDVIDLPPTQYLTPAKKTFEQFCIDAGYPMPFEKQKEMRAWVLDAEGPNLLLGSRGYGKTDYCLILGIAYDIYLHPNESRNLIITKSRERNSAIIKEIENALIKNGVTPELASSSRLRVKGITGKDHSVSVTTLKSVSLRGRHPKRIIFDDPVTPEDVGEASRKLLKRVYEETFKLCKDIRIMGQPVHKFDLYADLRGVIPTLEVPHGTIPELDHDLEAQRLAGVDEASIQASYFLKVLSEGVNPFDKVKYISEFIPGESVAFIDPSFEGGDYTAISIMRSYMGGVAVVGFTYKKAWNHCLDEMAPQLAKYNVKRICFETNSLGEMPVVLLRQTFPSIGVTGRKSNGNKHSRIMAAGAYAHLIHISKQSDKIYLDQVVKYEYKSKFDDAPDSLASCLEWIGLIRGKT